MVGDANAPPHVVLRLHLPTQLYRTCTACRRAGCFTLFPKQSPLFLKKIGAGGPISPPPPVLCNVALSDLTRRQICHPHATDHLLTAPRSIWNPHASPQHAPSLPIAGLSPVAWSAAPNPPPPAHVQLALPRHCRHAPFLVTAATRRAQHPFDGRRAPPNPPAVAAFPSPPSYPPTRCRRRGCRFLRGRRRDRCCVVCRAVLPPSPAPHQGVGRPPPPFPMATATRLYPARVPPPRGTRGGRVATAAASTAGGGAAG